MKNQFSRPFKRSLAFRICSAFAFPPQTLTNESISPLTALLSRFSRPSTGSITSRSPSAADTAHLIARIDFPLPGLLDKPTG